MRAHAGCILPSFLVAVKRFFSRIRQIPSQGDGLLKMHLSSYDVCMFPKHHNNIFEERSPTPCDNITFKTSF